MNVYIPAKKGYGEHEDRGSKFLAWVFHCATEEDFLSRLQELNVAHPKAGHHCWAWRIDEAFRSSDDGEPSGTAGRPMLRVLEGSGLNQVAVICVRYWGGTKLGTGGLVRAYSSAARLAVDSAGRVEVVPRKHYFLEIPFELNGLRDEWESKCPSIKFSGDFNEFGWIGDVSLESGLELDTFHRIIEEKAQGLIKIRPS